MTPSYLLLGFLVVASGPWLVGCLEALLNMPYGLLVLILLGSLSFAISVNPDYSEKIADGWASEWGISVSDVPSPTALATEPIDTVLKETKVRPEIRHSSENQPVPAKIVPEPLGTFSPLHIAP